MAINFSRCLSIRGNHCNSRIPRWVGQIQSNIRERKKKILVNTQTLKPIHLQSIQYLSRQIFPSVPQRFWAASQRMILTFSSFPVSLIVFNIFWFLLGFGAGFISDSMHRSLFIYFTKKLYVLVWRGKYNRIEKNEHIFNHISQSVAVCGSCRKASGNWDTNLLRPEGQLSYFRGCGRWMNV